MQVGNTWRTTQDISLAISATWDSVMNNLEGTKGLARFAGPGGWNDADMLEVLTDILPAGDMDTNSWSADCCAEERHALHSCCRRRDQHQALVAIVDVVWVAEEGRSDDSSSASIWLA